MAEEEQERERPSRPRKAPAAKKASPPPRRPSGTAAAVQGAHQLVELTGRPFEGIVGFSGDGDGWTVQVEVLEMRRIPNTTDVLAVYEVDLDRDGDLVGYRRVDRYLRGSSGEDRG